MAMSSTDDEAVLDWAHLDTLVKDFLPPREWVERVDHGFEQIAVNEAKVKHLKERLSTPQLKGSKRLRAESQLDQLESKLATLKAGHDEGAKVLRQKALALNALPREMRDAIFEQIYVQPEPIRITWSRLGNTYVFDMPKDVALYMSSLHVGPPLAREAAEIFYQKNTFTFVQIQGAYPSHENPGFQTWNQERIESWFSHDHYASGVAPKDFVRKLRLAFDSPTYSFAGGVLINWQSPSDAELCNHMQFEEAYGGVIAWQDSRSRLRAFLSYNTLQSIECTVSQVGDSFDLFARMLNPAFRELQAAGIKVTMSQRSYGEASPELDLTSIFDPPNDADYAQYYQLTQRKSVFIDDPNQDIFDKWEIIEAGGHSRRSFGGYRVRAYEAKAEKFGFMRVWLFEHYEMCKFLARDRQLFGSVDRIVNELRHLSPEDRDLRLRLYPRMVEYLR